MISLKKIGFLGLVAGVILLPFLGYKCWWLAGSEKTTGTMGFIGKEQTGQYIHTYSVIYFTVGQKKYWFNGTDNILLKENEKVSLRYSKMDPYDAKMNSFIAIWGDTLVYGGIPIAILLVIFLHPFIIPRKAIFKISIRPPYFKMKGE